MYHSGGDISNGDAMHVWEWGMGDITVPSSLFSYKPIIALKKPIRKKKVKIEDGERGVRVLRKEVMVYIWDQKSGNNEEVSA